METVQSSFLISNSKKLFSEDDGKDTSVKGVGQYKIGIVEAAEPLLHRHLTSCIISLTTSAKRSQFSFCFYTINKQMFDLSIQN